MFLRKDTRTCGSVPAGSYGSTEGAECIAVSVLSSISSFLFLTTSNYFFLYIFLVTMCILVHKKRRIETTKAKGIPKPLGSAKPSVSTATTHRKHQRPLLTAVPLIRQSFRGGSELCRTISNISRAFKSPKSQTHAGDYKSRS